VPPQRRAPARQARNAAGGWRKAAAARDLVLHRARQRNSTVFWPYSRGAPEPRGARAAAAGGARRLI